MSAVLSLILDSGAFISGSKLENFGPQVSYLTTGRVLSEIRDKIAREKLEKCVLFLPFLLVPSRHPCRFFPNNYLKLQP